MKKTIKNIYSAVLSVVLVGTSVFFTACNDNPDAFELTSGTPKVSYVRVPDALSADSLLSSAFMGKTIAIIGENLTSVKELWFNDQKATLNTSFITSNALIVAVPQGIPQLVTNKMYLINKDNDTISFDFKVDVPAPLISSMKCEYAEVGDTAVLIGNYFLPVAGADNPEVVFTPNIKATEIVSFNQNEIKVKVPAGAMVGPVTVVSRYGATRSKLYFRDNRGLILDWDNSNANGGWRSGVLTDSDPVAGIAGKYVRFKGDLKDDSWNEDGFSFNLWGTSNGRPQGDLFNIPLENAVMKFEVNVYKTWSACGLQMIFTPWETSGTNVYIGGKPDQNPPIPQLPGAIWNPWSNTAKKEFTTNGWITVSIPLKDFKYNRIGEDIGAASIGGYGGLTFFVYSGGVKGSDCSPVICIDNIRVVPAE